MSRSLRWAILDTSVYIGHWETGRYDDLLLAVRQFFIVRHSAVVQADWEIHKRREFQNDALIGLTARRHGATVVTANHGDFSFLGSGLGISVMYA